VDKPVINLQKDKTPKLQPYIHNSQSELEPFKSATGLESLGSTKDLSYAKFDWTFVELKDSRPILCFKGSNSLWVL
jgi:hypothetical protein